MDTILGVVLTYAVENIFPHIASYIAEKALHLPVKVLKMNQKKNQNPNLIFPALAIGP